MIPMNEIVEHCDKCGTEVSVKNDAVTMHSIAWDEPYSGLLSYRRCINCSPSRAQHIVHESFEPIVDDRPEYDKRLFGDQEEDKKKIEMFERRWTSAWLMCQDEEIAEAYLAKLFVIKKCNWGDE